MTSQFLKRSQDSLRSIHDNNNNLDTFTFPKKIRKNDTTECNTKQTVQSLESLAKGCLHDL